MGGRRSKKRKQRVKYVWGNRLAVIGITAVVLSLGAVVELGASSLREKDEAYQAREQELEKAYEKELARKEQLQEYQIYVQTKEYVEKVAKEKLGLVKKDEILFKPDESR